MYMLYIYIYIYLIFISDFYPFVKWLHVSFRVLWGVLKKSSLVRYIELSFMCKFYICMNFKKILFLHKTANDWFVLCQKTCVSAKITARICFEN